LKWRLGEINPSHIS